METPEFKPPTAQMYLYIMVYDTLLNYQRDLLIFKEMLINDLVSHAGKKKII